MLVEQSWKEMRYISPFYRPPWGLMVTPSYSERVYSHLIDKIFTLCFALRGDVPVVIRSLKCRTNVKTRIVKVSDVTISIFVRLCGGLYWIDLVVHLFIYTHIKFILISLYSGVVYPEYVCVLPQSTQREKVVIGSSPPRHCF